MSTDPFEQTPPTGQAASANVAVIDKPKVNISDDDYMQTIVENITAKASHNGLLEDDEFSYQVLSSSDEKQIKELLAAGYQGALGHPYNSKEDGRIVLKISKEAHGLKYETEAHIAARKLRKIQEQGGDISAEKTQGASAKFSDEQSIKDLLDKLPETEKAADLEAIRRFNPNAVDFDEDQ
jgi:hypothetical protein